MAKTTGVKPKNTPLCDDAAAKIQKSPSESSVVAPHTGKNDDNASEETKLTPDVPQRLNAKIRIFGMLPLQIHASRSASVFGKNNAKANVFDACSCTFTTTHSIVSPR